MRQVKSILVVIEQQQFRQPALERALALYNMQMMRASQKRRDLRIIAVMPVFDNSWDLTQVLSIEQSSEMKKNLLQKYEKWLDAYLRIHAMGVPVERKVICSRSLGKDLTSIAKEEGCDILIKAADVHGLLDSVLFTPLDWQLLRHAPIPVFIAKDHMWSPTGTIAVAIDLSSPDDFSLRLTNMRLLREAQELSKYTGGSIHIINAIPPFVSPATLDMPGLALDSIADSVLKDGCKAVLSFAKRHKIPAENCHIREGQPDEVIPSLCKELNPTALFIGTSARKGLAVALVGNICERVVDELDCDVAVITPKSVIERIPTSNQTKTI